MSRILDGMVTESGILSAFCNICQRFKSETGSLSGTVEVTYVSLKSVYSIQDRWDGIALNLTFTHYPHHHNRPHCNCHH